MTERKDLFIKDFEELLDNSERDIHTKIRVSKALVDNIDSLISDWGFAKNAVMKGLENLEDQLENKDPGDPKYIKAPEMDKYTRQLIKEISSNFANADIDNRIGEDANELKHLLLAINSITVMLQGNLNGKIDHTIASSYANTLKDTVNRVNNLIEAGVE